jgi:hypothetical protein
MTITGYANACRRRTRELLKIVEGIYDDKERLALERMIWDFEQLAIEAGPPRPEAAERRAVPRNGSGRRSAAGRAQSVSV